jgi:protein O-mannosyl-transferase
MTAAEETRAARPAAGVTTSKHTPHTRDRQSQPRIPPSPRGRRWLEDARVVAALLGAAVIVAYGQVWRHDFVNLDDPTFVTDNDWVRQGVTLGGVVWAFTSTLAANWHPLTSMSHMVDYQIFGMNAGGHHLTNVALHVVNTLLLFVVLRRMTGTTGRSALVAFLFGLHPLHVESVAWIAERKDVLSTTFLFLALGAYERYTRQPTLGRYAAVLVAFALGLMSKPMLVTFPFLLLLLDFWPLGRLLVPGAAAPAERRGRDARPLGRLVLEKLPLFALSVAISIVTLVAQQDAMGSVEDYPLSLRLMNASLAYVRYARKMFWPVDLAIFYPYDTRISPWLAGGALVLLLGVSIVAIRAYRTRPALTVGWLWYVGGLVPVIGIVQVGRQALADRYSYVPLVGLFIAIVWMAADLLERPRPAWRWTAVGAIVAVCLVTTTMQVSYWRDSVTLFGHALAVTRDNYMAYLQVGAQLDADGKPSEAARYYSDALRVKPDYAEAHNNLGLLLAKGGDPAAAMQHYDAALRFDPAYPDAHYNRGLLLHRTGNPRAAAKEYGQVLALKPSYAKAHSNLGLILYEQGDLDGARAHLAEAVRVRPDFVDARINYGVVLRAAGQVDAAVAQDMEALRLAPSSAQAHFNLANVLAQRGDVDAAARHYREAVRLKPDYDAAREMLERLTAPRSG